MSDTERKPVNFRLMKATRDRLERLAEAMAAALNVAVSQADVIHAALIELEKKYPPPTEKKGKK